MFRKNTEHLQGSIFGTVEMLLGESQKKAYLESRERWFYELVFKRIDEKAFAPLYSEEKSRPNAAIN
ncbi:MAG TPA: DDE transposase, partial [Methanocellales archaeon]|nr:DDE transposase [Methanocellales archaeon]